MIQRAPSFRQFAVCAALLAGCLVITAAAQPSDGAERYWKGVTEYRRPFGPQAPWNVPVAGLPQDARSAQLAQLLYNDAPSARPGNFNLNFGDGGYTYPVYSAADATGSYTVKTTWPTPINGTKIPWNPAWKPAPGSDAQAIVLDPASGREWDLWQVSFDGSTLHATNGSLVPGDYHTYEGGNVPSRGAGIEYQAMLVRPEEIAQGKIAHALSLPIRNTDGDTYVAPATKLEHPGNPPGVPEGTRFALNVSDTQITSWLNGLPAGLSAETLRSAKIIAEALRDYGWIITDTAGGAEFQFEARASAGSKWDSLGLSNSTLNYKNYPTDLLDGLITQDRIYAVVPSNQYPTGTGTGTSPPPAPVPTTMGTSIVVNAYGTAAKKAFAHFNVLIDGVKVGDATTSSAAKSFTFNTTVTADTAHKVQVQYDNDATISGQDRNLFVNKITINGHDVAPTASNVTYDKGALDGKDVVAGQSGMWWGGTLVVSADKTYFASPVQAAAPLSAAAANMYEHAIAQTAASHSTQAADVQHAMAPFDSQGHAVEAYFGDGHTDLSHLPFAA